MVEGCKDFRRWYGVTRKSGAEFVLPVGRCPFCGASGAFQVKGRIDNIPYFGEIMETSVSCSSCRFRHSDVMCLGERVPMRYEFQITSEKDLMVRVVKSSTGMIKLPELGVTVEPGPSSEGFVSNVEGVLNRIEEGIRLAVREADAVRHRRGKAKIKKLDAIRAGKRRARLIILDPFGHSAIVDERAKGRKLTRRELASLKVDLPR